MANWTITETHRAKDKSPLYAVACNGKHVTTRVVYPDALEWVAVRIKEGDTVTENNLHYAPMTVSAEEFLNAYKQI